MSVPVTLEGKLLFPSNFISAIDLQGRDVLVEIERVEQQDLRMAKGGTKKKAVLSFKGKAKKFVLNKTNAVAIAGIHGPELTAWVGKSITIYPTTTTFGRDTVDCIRVRGLNENAE